MAIEDRGNQIRDFTPMNRRIMGGGGPDQNQWPPWLNQLLKQKFFVHCKFHGESHKTECNKFCLDCSDSPLCSLCSLCLVHHRDHRAIQVRRSSYHDVIRVSEIQKYLDISAVQTYVINSAKVVFLNERPQTKPGKGPGGANACHVCRRGLLDSFKFCSIGCNYKYSVCLVSDKRSPDICASTALSFTPSMPPPTEASHRAVKRRKGIPHRSPTGVVAILV